MIKKIFYILIAISITLTAQAENLDKVKVNIQNKFPNMDIETIDYVKQLNLYEIKLKGVPSYAYTNDSFDFFLLNGELIDPKSKQNYTKEIGFIKIKEFYKNILKDESFSIKYGDGSRGIIVFSDPDCPFCKQLDSEIHSKLINDNITIHYFMNPLPIPGHENAPLKAKKILCDSNPSEAWKNWIKSGTLPNNDGNCKNANKLSVSVDVAKTNGFQSTPIIIFDNGITSMKALSANDIKAALNSRK